MDYTTWEEDFIDDSVSTLRDSNGAILGEVRRVGDSWNVRYGLAPIARRATKEGAQDCLNKYHDVVIKERGAK